MTILAGAATVHAQQTPAQQPPPAQQPQSQPDNQQSSSQEASNEDITRPAKVKVKDFTNWTYNAGGGASLTNGTTKTFVRSGGGIAAAGVARNAKQVFGLRLDFQFDNLPLRSSALQLAQAPGATSHVYSLGLDPIINIPVTKDWGGYLVFGPSYFHRSGKLDSTSMIPGSACNPFYEWWGTCFAGSLPIGGGFRNASENQLATRFAVAASRAKLPRRLISTPIPLPARQPRRHSPLPDLRPITIGLRW